MRLNKNYLKILRQITLFDWIFIAIGIGFVLVFYLFFKRDVVFITARFKVTDENVLYASNAPSNEFATSFMVGDTQRDEFGQVVSEIVGVNTYNLVPEKQIAYLDIRLKAVYNPRTHQYAVKGKNILFGETFDFSFTKVRFKALVVDFPGFIDQKNIQSQKTMVRAQLRTESRLFSDVYGVPDYLANALKVGDVVKDSKKNILVKIVDVSINPAKRLIVNSAGQPFIVDDPYLKDVFYTIELSTKIINGKTYMFDYLPVLVGATIPINTDTVSLTPTIIEITTNK